jgi:hypothetical protein
MKVTSRVMVGILTNEVSGTVRLFDIQKVR